MKANTGHKRSCQSHFFAPADTVSTYCYVKRLIQSSRSQLESTNVTKNTV